MLDNNSQSTFAEVSTFFLCLLLLSYLFVMLARNGFGYGYDDCQQAQPSTKHGPSLE